MLGYISSTRKKSCQACVRAKRRCDLGYPICKRCFTKGIHCAYPNAAVREAEVIIRQTTPDLLPVVEGASDTASSDPLQQEHSVFDSVFPSTEQLETEAEAHDCSLSSSPESIAQDGLCNALLESLVPQIWEPRILNERQVQAIVNELCGFVPSMAYEGHTLFMHEALYETWQPPTYQDTCSLSALYMSRTRKNVSILTNSIDAKISTLIASYCNWSLSEHLAAVQAMIIFQIIRLFDPSLDQQPLAHKQNSLLELWTATLWKRSGNEPSTFNSCYESWVFQESLRRTVLMSVFLRGAWSCVTKGGLCDQVPVLARLPLTGDVRLWECGAEEWMERGVCPKKGGFLVAYGDLSYSWKPGVESVEDMNAFERLLLVACRGGDDPRLLA